MLQVLTLVIALVSLCIGVLALVRGRSLRAALQDAHRRLYLAQARLNELENMIQKELMSLRAEVRRRSGAPVFDPSMRIADAIALDPRVRDVLAGFHVGGCSACAIDAEQTIERAAASYGVNVERLMAALTALSNGQEPPQRGHHPGGLLQLDVF